MRSRSFVIAATATLVALAALACGESGTQPEVCNDGTPPPCDQGDLTIPVQIDVTIDTLTGLVITPAEATLAIGGTAQLTALAVIGNANTVPVAALWASASPSLAQVDSTGLVTAVAAGTARIVAVHGAIAASATITVQ